MSYKPDAPASACPKNDHSTAKSWNVLVRSENALAGASGLYREET